MRGRGRSRGRQLIARARARGRAMAGGGGVLWQEGFLGPASAPRGRSPAPPLCPRRTAQAAPDRARRRRRACHGGRPRSPTTVRVRRSYARRLWCNVGVGVRRRGGGGSSFSSSPKPATRTSSPSTRSACARGDPARGLFAESSAGADSPLSGGTGGPPPARRRPRRNPRTLRGAGSWPRGQPRGGTCGRGGRGADVTCMRGGTAVQRESASVKGRWAGRGSS